MQETVITDKNGKKKTIILDDNDFYFGRLLEIIADKLDDLSRRRNG